MLIRNLTADNVYLACGRTDMRKPIDDLAAQVLSKFQLAPHPSALFLFCGRRKDCIKGLLWDETGFLLLYILSNTNSQGMKAISQNYVL